MNDEELRALVRAAIARHGGAAAEPGAPIAQAGAMEWGPGYRPPAAVTVRLHPSHGVFTLPAGSDLEGPCLIEPAVLCTHCGYCKSYGH